MNKLKAIGQWVSDRLSEASTWQGIGFAIGLFTAKFNGMDWGQGAALGGIISAAIKAIQKG